MADLTGVIVLVACLLALFALGGIWLRWYRRARRTQSEFGKATVHESSLNKNTPS
jgi:hypothetical protein